MGIMKNLMDVPLRQFSTYAFIILLISLPVYFLVINSIWIEELDEHNLWIKESFVENSKKLDENTFFQTIDSWNALFPSLIIKEIEETRENEDSVFTTTKTIKIGDEVEENQFRVLESQTVIHNKPMLLRIETNYEENDETFLSIAILTFIFFLAIIIGLVLLNRKISGRLWKPFNQMLAQLDGFNLNGKDKFQLPETDIIEFSRMSHTVEELVNRNMSIYEEQKVFLENASHELQTPLAIANTKVELLYQSESLDERDLNILSEIEKALKRMSRMNQSLLFLSKLENNQFRDQDEIQLSALVSDAFSNLHELYENNALHLTSEITPFIIVQGNKVLVEMLIYNLVSNAFKHTNQSGRLEVLLTKSHLTVINSGSVALDRELIFRRFYKNQQDPASTGLGLAIAKEICSTLGWILTYEFKDTSHKFSVSF
jgi:signal transduction histidine kinase